MLNMSRKRVKLMENIKWVGFVEVEESELKVERSNLRQKGTHATQIETSI